MKITLRAPDDWHCHLRDNAYLATTVPIAAKQFKRVVVMPNLKIPVTTVESALAYRERILAYVPFQFHFTPLMTLYLTDDTSPAVIEAAKQAGIIGCKLYPLNVTTYAQHGVSHIAGLYPVFEKMEQVGMPLLIHGETHDVAIDVFDRERIFIERTLSTIVNDFPGLKIVLEHISTKAAVHFIQSCSSLVAATITPHHLYANRNALFNGGIRPHYYCLPILKREEDQAALIQAAISGSKQFFIGTDSAPHAKSQKESTCGCAGIFHPYALSIYAHIFEEHEALDKLEDFTSRWGAEFYGLPLSEHTVTLQKRVHTAPLSVPFGDETVYPFLGGETLYWSLTE